MIPVSAILGLGRIPSHRTSASEWFERNGVATFSVDTDGRRPVFVSLDSLPEPERRVWLEISLERVGQKPGAYDEDAHAKLQAAPTGIRQDADRKAQILQAFLVLPADATWPDKIKALHSKFGPEGISKTTLKRHLSAVEGVDPINFAPALLPAYKSNPPRAKISEDAWSTFLASVKKAAHSHSLTAIYDDVALVAQKRGWDWPSYPTIQRRWLALPRLERDTLRHGGSQVVRDLYQPKRRSVDRLSSLEVVEMDGRTLDLWAEFEDGTIARPVMLALVDRASFKALHFVIGKAETALLTRDLILETCDRYGIFDRLVTDNSRAFSSLLVAGGVKHKFRNAGTRRAEWEPPGLCEHLGIDLKFTQPHNPGAKIPESKFAVWSRKVDTRPEFAAAHAGHNPLDRPSDDVVPVPIAIVRDIYLRELKRDNAKANRRTQNAQRGESYNDTFERLKGERIHRPVHPAQRWRASLLYQVRKVNRVGQVRANGWVYGRDSIDGSQEALLRYEGKPILIGTDPSDFSAPAVAFDLDTRREIFAGIQPDMAGDYRDKDGAREAAKERKRLRKITSELNAKHDMDLTEFYADLDDCTDVGSKDDPRPQKVVQPTFTDPITSPKRTSGPDRDAIAEDFWERRLAAQKERKASGGNR